MSNLHAVKLYHFPLSRFQWFLLNILFTRLRRPYSRRIVRATFVHYVTLWYYLARKLPAPNKIVDSPMLPRENSTNCSFFCTKWGSDESFSDKFVVMCELRRYCVGQLRASCRSFIFGYENFTIFINSSSWKLLFDGLYRRLEHQLLPRKHGMSLCSRYLIIKMN